MELKEGMYVRTKNGIIGKYNVIKEFANVPNFNGSYETKEVEREYIDDKPYRNYEVIKASNNIIDLIECLDIVELYIIGLEEDNITTIKRPETLRELKDLKKYIKRGAKIKSITTKEQFESISYKVGE